MLKYELPKGFVAESDFEGEPYVMFTWTTIG
jgi:hypothetical protein